MKYLKPGQKLLLSTMFYAAASLFIFLSSSGLIHGNEMQAAGATKGRPCGGGDRSCDPTMKGVVCNHWVTLIEDSFEDGFPGSEWEPGGWKLTNCTSSEGENSIWCDESETPCSGPYYSSEREAYTTHDSLDIPTNCAILKVSFDYKYTEAPDIDRIDEFFMVYLNWLDPWDLWADW